MTLEWKFNTIPNSTKTYLLSSFFFLVLDAECFLPCLFNWFSCEVFLGICKFRYRAVMTRSTQWYLAAGAEGFSGPIWFGLSNVFIQLHSTRKYSWCLSWATDSSGSLGRSHSKYCQSVSPRLHQLQHYTVQVQITLPGTSVGGLDELAYPNSFCLPKSIFLQSIKNRHISYYHCTLFIYLCFFIGFPGDSGVKNLPAIPKRLGLDPWVGKIPWRRAWLPTPVFQPGESYGRGAWRASVHGVAKSRI